MTNSFISNNICFIISSFSEWKLFYRAHQNLLEEIYNHENTGLFTVKNKNIKFHITGIGNELQSDFLEYIKRCNINYFINLGFSGAINSNLKQNTIVVPNKYINPSGKISQIPQYEIKKRNIKSALLYTADHPVQTKDEQKAIRKKYNADIVDMEYGLYIKKIKNIGAIKIISDNANNYTINDFKLNLYNLRILFKEIIEDIIF